MESTAVDGQPRASDASPQLSCPVDLSHLRRYTFGDANLEKEVLGLFLGQLPKTLAALSTATTERDWKMAAHTLKGSGRAVGAWRIARLAEGAEKLASQLNGEVCRPTLCELEEAAREAREFIESRFDLG